MNDPQAGAAVELMNDFVFGRGVPRPRCKDPLVQKVVDDAWDDPDNAEVLTTFEAQLALGVDLAIQSNLFVLSSDDGEDGKVKLSMLRHDDVQGAVPDPEKRHRVLYYIARERALEWDYETDSPQAARPSPVDSRSTTSTGATSTSPGGGRARPAVPEGAGRPREAGARLPPADQPRLRADFRHAALPADAALVLGVQRLRQGPARHREARPPR
jgi:hypothetical protein